MPSIYEKPLHERFEAASEELARSYFLKRRIAREGVLPYPWDEKVADVYRAAGNHGLFTEALWAYFRMLYID